MPRFGFVKWNKGESWASLVLADDFYLWNPCIQLDALFDIKSDIEDEIERAREVQYLKKDREPNGKEKD
jgi:hypothetical protein